MSSAAHDAFSRLGHKLKRRMSSGSGGKPSKLELEQPRELIARPYREPRAVVADPSTTRSRTSRSQPPMALQSANQSTEVFVLPAPASPRAYPPSAAFSARLTTESERKKQPERRKLIKRQSSRDRRAAQDVAAVSQRLQELKLTPSSTVQEPPKMEASFRRQLSDANRKIGIMLEAMRSKDSHSKELEEAITKLEDTLNHARAQNLDLRSEISASAAESRCDSFSSASSTMSPPESPQLGFDEAQKRASDTIAGLTSHIEQLRVILDASEQHMRQLNDQIASDQSRRARSRSVAARQRERGRPMSLIGPNGTVTNITASSYNLVPAPLSYSAGSRPTSMAIDVVFDGAYTPPSSCSSTSSSSSRSQSNDSHPPLRRSKTTHARSSPHREPVIVHRGSFYDSSESPINVADAYDKTPTESYFQWPQHSLPSPPPDIPKPYFRDSYAREPSLNPRQSIISIRPEIPMKSARRLPRPYIEEIHRPLGFSDSVLSFHTAREDTPTPVPCVGAYEPIGLGCSYRTRDLMRKTSNLSILSCESGFTLPSMRVVS